MTLDDIGLTLVHSVRSPRDDNLHLSDLMTCAPWLSWLQRPTVIYNVIGRSRVRASPGQLHFLFDFFSSEGRYIQGILSPKLPGLNCMGLQSIYLYGSYQYTMVRKNKSRIVAS